MCCWAASAGLEGCCRVQPRRWRTCPRPRGAGRWRSGRIWWRARPERFWTSLLQHGGWWDFAGARAAPTAEVPVPVDGVPRLAEPELAGDASEFPFYLAVAPHHTLGAGESAHL